MTNLIYVLRSLKEHCYGNRFLARNGENWHTPHSFCALAFHKKEDLTTDARVNMIRQSIDRPLYV